MPLKSGDRVVIVTDRVLYPVVEGSSARAGTTISLVAGDEFNVVRVEGDDTVVISLMGLDPEDMEDPTNGVWQLRIPSKFLRPA